MKASQKTHRHHHRTHHDRARQRKFRDQHRKRRHQAQQDRRNLVFRLHKTITHSFPPLYEQLQDTPDCRTLPTYSLAAILGAGLLVFVFKKGSRNAMNNERAEPEFRKNYTRLFKQPFPHMDTVNNVLKVLDPAHLDRLAADLVQDILAKKTLRPFRMQGQYDRVVIDGTQVMTVKEGHCPHCLHRPLRNGKIQYFHNVVAAKLVCPNGFCLPLASVWLSNHAEYDKQDCELNGWRRLAQKLKQSYPRLPLCIVADGLYPNEPFFQICRENGWQWLVTFQDGNLPSVWSQVIVRQGRERCRSRRRTVERRGQTVRQCYEWLAGLTYQGVTIHWFTCVELVEGKMTEFTSLSSLSVDYQHVIELSDTGRLRWKIENEGFNIQKHHGYGLGHQFSRRSMRAMENYEHVMQIGHLINQLFELSSLCTSVQRSKESLHHLWLALLGELRGILDVTAGLAQFARRMRFRYP